MAGETQAADATATQEEEDRDEDFDAGFNGATAGTTETPAQAALKEGEEARGGGAAGAAAASF